MITSKFIFLHMLTSSPPHRQLLFHLALIMAPTTADSSLMNQPPLAPPTSGSRSRPQARKKPNDDGAAYFGQTLPASAVITTTTVTTAANSTGTTSVIAAGTKRQGERPEGEARVKRKKVDAPTSSAVAGSSSGNARRSEKERMLHAEGSGTKTSMVFFFLFSYPLPLRHVTKTDFWHNKKVDFTTLPLTVLYRYLSHFDLIPSVHPSPLTARDPPPPMSLQNSHRPISRSSSPTVSVTPANRPRRDPKDPNRRRSSLRLLEEEFTRTPILADVAETHIVLAGIAERHFHQYAVREVETLANFISFCKATKSLKS
jgi:hypothetical protein